MAVSFSGVKPGAGLLVALFAVLLGAATTSANAAPTPAAENMRFTAPAAPFPLTDPMGAQLCTELLAAMKDGRKFTDDFLAFLPADTATRTVMLTWSSGQLSSSQNHSTTTAGAPRKNYASELDKLKDAVQRDVAKTKPSALPKVIVENAPAPRATVRDKSGKVVADFTQATTSGGTVDVVHVHGQNSVGTSTGLRNAIREALRQARECAGEDVRGAKFLKLDIIQHAVAIPHFILYESPIHQPSVIGIAIPARNSLFILPPEVLANCVSPDNLFRPKEMPPLESLCTTRDVTRQTAEWMEVTSQHQPIPDAMYVEMQSYFTDGESAVPMFRGHRMPGFLDARQLGKAGDQAADFLGRQIREDGSFACTLPAWHCSGDGKETPGDYAETLCSLLEWQELRPSTERAATIEVGIRHLLQKLAPYPPVPGAKCLPETTVASNATVTDIVLRSRLRTTALLVLALEKYLTKQKYPAPLDTTLDALTAYLLNQQLADGNFFAERIHPTGAVVADSAASCADQALATTALLRIHGRTGRETLLTAATRAAANLFQRKAQAANQAQTLENVAGQITVANELFTFTRDKTLPATAEKLAVWLLSNQTVTPVFPDFFGGVGNSSALAPVAVQTSGVLTAAQLCYDTRRLFMSEKLFSGAHGSLIFQLQGQADAASTLFLPEGTGYGGAFRNSLAETEFHLTGQAKNLAALAAAMRLLNARGDTALPVSTDLKRDHAETLTRLTLFPRCLPEEIK